MTDPELPPELAKLERRLVNRRRTEPAADLGPRVLAAARAALRPRPAPWRAWAAAAAVVLLGINLSMSLAAGTDWELLPAADPDAFEATAEHLRRLAPDLPEAELRRQALLARAAAGLTPAVNLTPDWNHIRTNKERDRWDGP
jgi:hypothetical protein